MDKENIDTTWRDEWLKKQAAGVLFRFEGVIGDDWEFSEEKEDYLEVKTEEIKS